MKELSSDVSPSDYINLGMVVAKSQSQVDVESIAWRQESEQESIKLIMGSKNIQGNEDPMEIVGDDKSEEIIDSMAIKSISETLQIVNRVMHFFQQHGNEELDQSLMTIKTSPY